MLFIKLIVRRSLYSFLLVAWASFFASAQSISSPEYQLKAVFLYNFTQFVEWPATSFSNDQAPLVIGILGKDPFGTYLNETIAGEKINGHPLLIQHFSNYEDIKTCHVLFISDPDPNKIGQITESLKKYSILTVSDASDFLSQGGMVKFFTKNNKIQFQINSDSAREANLMISSKLMRLATAYDPAK